MTGRCPACGAKIDLARASADADWLALTAELAALGARSSLVLEYVQAFAGKSGRGLLAATTLRLVREVRHLIESGRFVYDGVEYRLDLAQIDEALKDVATRGLVGLTNHNYLKTVMIGLASKRRHQGGVDASQSRRVAKGEAVIETPPQADPELAQQIRRFNETLSGVGKPMPDATGED